MIRLVDGAGFAPYAEQSLQTYRLAMGRSAEQLEPRRPILARHRTYAGFRAMLATDDDDRLVGFGYGYPGRSGQWWHDVVRAALDPADRRRWLADCFEVAELHVHPDHQGRGIGRALLTGLLTGVAGRTTMLSTPDTESAARRLYRSTGFTDVLTGFRFPGMSEDFCVMGRPLPLDGP